MKPVFRALARLFAVGLCGAQAICQIPTVTDAELDIIWRLPEVEQIRAFHRLSPARKEAVANKIWGFDHSGICDAEFRAGGWLRRLFALDDKRALEIADLRVTEDWMSAELSGELARSRTPRALRILAKGVNLKGEFGLTPEPPIEHYLSSMEYFGKNNDFLPEDVKDWFKILGEDGRLIRDRRQKLFDMEVLGKLSVELKQKYPLCLDPFYSTIIRNRMRDIVREWWKENATHIEGNAFAMVRPGKRLVAFEGVLAPYAAVWRDVELANAELTGKPPAVLDSATPEPTTGAKSAGFDKDSPKSEELREQSNPFLTIAGVALVAFGTSFFLWRKRKHRVKGGQCAKSDNSEPRFP